MAANNAVPPQQHPSWGWVTHGSVRVPIAWVPQMTNRPKICTDQNCCKRQNGEYWQVRRDPGWQLRSEPDFVAARDIATEAANYCTECRRTEKQRLAVLMGAGVGAGADPTLHALGLALGLL